ncbi:MAG: 7-carboxy-7-deazaguanine synthase QueE [Proteobacteria bacterium]|nr:7-carboxy-7-deazaguanine synthase QueE [Pseudomonadota bacterium]MBK9253085.1 7-carboxy-7-deazaguanine synthase QueE [Pseudomonadota bacterium]MCC6632021.1 7-carboxy-7-deazaguanine synthase QueE [Gammaproteobacteria bacterium]
MNAPAAPRLKITEIFRSLQGEGDTVGFPTVFVRLTGCPLRCHYCDTAYAFGGGEWMSLDEIVTSVRAQGTRHVCVTGGEPLAQANCLPLLEQLCDAGLRVSLETSGALPVDQVDARVSRVVDVKTPDSGEAHRNLLDQLQVLGEGDQVKFVICSRSDYEWSRQLVRERNLADHTMVLFSPSHDQVAARDLAEWILADGLPVRLQVQLHKILWGNEPGR